MTELLPAERDLRRVIGDGDALPDGEVVYVGDGYSDRCAALAADRVFARDGLARYLDAHGAAYEPYDDLHDVVRVL
jgi:2-hydroxy-3-keto-5-methylthiopentenyl-1-phosphate phosphatase